MPIFLSYVGRVADGIPLVASESKSATTSPEQLEMFRSQAKQLLKKVANARAAKMSIDSPPFIFYYIVERGICYLTLADKGYPKRLAFLFLEQLAEEFVNELSAQYGADRWMQEVETVGRPYAFIRFDKTIQRKHREFSDPTTNANTERVKSDLADIQCIMRQNINDVLDRGSKMDLMSERSRNLANKSKKYKWGAKQLSLMTLYRQYLPIIVIVCVVLVLLYFKFFW